MRRAVFAWILGILFPISALAQTSAATFSKSGSFSLAPREADEELSGPFTLKQGQYAVFHTTQGDFVAELLSKEAPKTVENFVGLATGKKRWKHPITQADMTTPLYNNTAIYKIVPNVAIYGGDPIDKGAGGPGYTIDQENIQGNGFATAGALAMDNSGKQSNGSRWFVTLIPLPDWKGRFTVFGHVIGGLDVARDISHMPTKRPLVPLEPALVNSVEIVEVPQGQEAKASFSTEEGKKVLTVDRNFTPAPGAAAPTAAEKETSPSAALTSATKALTGATSASSTQTSAPAGAAKP